MVDIPECELCGREVEKLVKIEVEGSIVEVCDRCVRYGKLVEVTPKAPPSMSKGKRKTTIEEDFVLIENYGKKIKEAREKLGLTRKDFAKKIAEKESVIKKIEEEKMTPDENLARKIEKTLNIKLFKKVPLTATKQEDRKERELTIGDVVIVRTK